MERCIMTKKYSSMQNFLPSERYRMIKPSLISLKIASKLMDMDLLCRKLLSKIIFSKK